MDEIIIRSFQGTLDVTEQQTLQDWRQHSHQNESYYQAMARTWKYAGLITAPAAPVDRVIASKSPIPIRRERPSRLVRSRIVAAALGTAAMLALGFAIGVLSRPSEPTRLGAEEFVTGRREMVTIRLTDGTVVRLAPRSRLRVGPDSKQREVWLDGRGFFAVAKDSARSFVVRTRTGDAVVLGTRFEVNVENDTMQVFVVEGRVSHQAGGQQVEVGAMQLSLASAGGIPEVRRVADAQPLLSWLGEFLVFQATPIHEVARELERRYDVTVRVADEDVGARTVTAWFSDETIEEVLLIVCRAADAHCSVRGDVVSIEP